MIEQFKTLSLPSHENLPSQVHESQIPLALLSLPPIKKINSILLTDFKSYDRKYVGPFLNFTSIIGPNGSGKSNILDAFLFCFCSQHVIPQLFDPRELIHRSGRQTFKELSQMEKKIVVQVQFILQNQEELIVSRSLHANGSENFAINFQKVQKRIYQMFLTSKGINCHWPNYAISQGQIDRLLLKNPYQFTEMFENISGSVYQKQIYEENQEKLNKVNQEIQEKTKIIMRLKKNKKNLLNIKTANEQYGKWEKKYQEIFEKMYYLKVVEKNIEFHEQLQEYEKVLSQEEKKKKEIQELKLKAQKDYQERSKLSSQINRVMDDLAKLHSVLKQIDIPIHLLKHQQMKEVKDSVLQLEKQIQNLEAKKQNLEKNIPEIPSSDIIDEYFQIYKEWEYENQALNREVVKKNNEMLYIEGIMQTKRSVLVDFDEKVRKYEESLKNNSKQVQNINRTVSELKEAIHKMNIQSQRVYENMERGKKQLAKKDDQLQFIYNNIEDLEVMIEEDAGNEKQKEVLRRLATVQGFLGVVDQKIKPTSSKYEVCFSIIFSAINKYLLCENEQNSKEIGQRLRDLNQLKNVVILDNVVPRRQNDVPKEIKKLALNAFEIVDFDTTIKGFDSFLREFLRGKVICNSISHAFQIRNKDLVDIKQIYTIDGTILRKNGSIESIGDAENVKKNYKYSSNRPAIFQDLNKLNKEKVKLETDIKNLKMKYDDREIIQRNLQITKMQQKVEELQRQKQYLKNYKAKEPQLPKSVERQLKDLQNQKNKIQKALIELEKMMQSSQIFAEFTKKHSIENLQVFRNSNNFQFIQKKMKNKQEIHKQLLILDNEIKENERKLMKKRSKRQKLQSEVQNLPKEEDKRQIQRNISEKQSNLKDLRMRISKLTSLSISQVKFKSEISALKAKLQYKKEKSIKELQELAEDYGVPFEYPVSEEKLEEELQIKLSRISQRRIKNIEQDLEQKRKKIQSHLDKQNSLYVVGNTEQNEEKVDKDLSKLEQDVEKGINQRQIIVDSLEEIKKSRRIQLLDFVYKMKPILSETYKILTIQDNYMSGNVDLFVEDERIPFEKGIYFTPTPPTKRFVYDLQQLSGGQKSIASLAFQYSIAIATESPFLILDETDAFLDQGNVKRFLNLIKKNLDEKNIQLIIVTHKQNLFSESDSLIGITRPPQTSISEAFSLNLNNE